MIRARICELLGEARRSVDAAESDYRGKHLPVPSRDRPRADPEALAGAQAFENLSREIGQIEGLVRAPPVPENDRMTQRYRREKETLARLSEIDTRLAGHAEFLRETVAGQTAEWLRENAELVRAGLGAIREVVRERREVLAGLV